MVRYERGIDDQNTEVQSACFPPVKDETGGLPLTASMSLMRRGGILKKSFVPQSRLRARHSRQRVLRNQSFVRQKRRLQPQREVAAPTPLDMQKFLLLRNDPGWMLNTETFTTVAAALVTVTPSSPSPNRGASSVTRTTGRLKYSLRRQRHLDHR